MFLNKFSEGNGCDEVEENNSNDTLVSDDDAHKVVLCTGSHFFCSSWVLTEVKGKEFKDTPHDKSQKELSVKNLLTKTIRKAQNRSTGSSKIGENHNLGKNSDF